MKYRILYLIALFAMFSCSEQLDSKFPVDNGLETTISVIVPQLPEAHPQSRAMALKPQLQNLKLAVFDNNGYLLEYVSATEVDLATENEPNQYAYKVTLRATEFPTYIHFIGNAPENIQYGTETEAIGSLFTENGDEAYWQRIELPNGIKQNADGTFDSSVTTALTDVRLVRNFAWIQLEETADNFEMDSYCVVNTYGKGSIAPYNTSEGEFADFGQNQTHDGLLNDGYNGFIPAGAELNTAIPSEETWFKTQGQDAASSAYFVYEREKALSNPPFILVKGTYQPSTGDSQTSYYKVDLRDANGSYFPLIRNFKYKVTITRVMHEGHETAEKAANGAGSGDVSTDVNTENFTNISNGLAQLFVSYTDTTLVAQTDELKLRYKFMVFETTDANGNKLTNKVFNGDNVTITKGEGDVIETFAKNGTDDSNGWREITIKTTELGTVKKSQDIIIKGAVTLDGIHYELQRKVTITLTPKYTMQLVCDPDAVNKVQGTPFDVIVKLPADLRRGMFPLDIQLEADNQSMTPNRGDDLPAITGESIISDKANKTTIGFVKQIQWADYAELINSSVGGYVSFTCHFKRNKEVAVGVNTLIYADNKYFEQASTTLGSYTPGTFSGSFTPSSTLSPGDEVTFNFTMSDIPSQVQVYVTLKGLEPADGQEEILIWDTNLGRYVYAITSDSGKSGSFKLTCDGTSNPASVTLSAYRFEDKEVTTNVQLNSFSDLRFNPSYLTPGSAQDFEFRFNMSKAPSNDVFVTLTNLVPANDETQLEEVGENTGKYKFKTRPTGTSASIKLRNTATAAGTTGTVQLTSLYFDDATANISTGYVIPAGYIKVGSVSQQITLYFDEPGWMNSNNQSLGISFTPTGSENKYNGNAIEISAENYQKIMQDGDDTIYLRYSTGLWSYYIASVSLSKLLDGTAGTLTFTEQGW